jgi:type IV pilus assembly protein PilB
MGFLDTLAQRNIIAPAEASAIAAEAEAGTKTAEELLLARGVAPEEILEAKGQYWNIPTRTLDSGNVPFEVLNYIPEKSASHYRFVPLGVRDGVLEIGVIDPDNIEAQDALQFISSKINLPYKLFLISEKDFKKVLDSYSSLSGEVTEALSELETELSGEDKELAEDLKEEPPKETKTAFAEDAPVTKIVATILRYAVEGNASDIHVEPLSGSVRVRFRVDGTLHTSLVLPLSVHNNVVARIKILSNMRLDEKRKPQDGRFPAHISGRKIDFRVSTFPTYYGEKLVMRILDSEKGVLKLDAMGITARNLDLIRKAIAKPYGMILISGPTGSGKTTTLYSMLNEINREENNVLSLEDPVEYSMQGVSQSQVRPEIGYTFANGLKTTLRQDPDVIMVGEIRDKETAGLAVQAALTGHLVLSTIHTNNAIGVIPRLIDMGVDPYLIAPTLILAMAQRLVRTLCPNAGVPLPIEGSIKLMVDKQLADLPEEYRSTIAIPDHVYNVGSAPDCPTGTRGRSAVFEVLEMDRTIESIILTNPTEDAIYKAARAKGMTTMREDALFKAFSGTVPFEEVVKFN